MEGMQRALHRLTGWFLDRLLACYPGWFRDEFSDELKYVLRARLLESQERGWWSWLGTVNRELQGLIVSLAHEHWNERRRRRGGTSMNAGEGPDLGALGMEGPTIQFRAARRPGWIAGWMVLTTVALPAAWALMAPVSILILWLLDNGYKAGWWAAPDLSGVQAIGLAIGLAVSVAAAQWVGLRRSLPRAWRWFAATFGGLLIGGFASALVVTNLLQGSWNPALRMIGLLLGVGLSLGVAQWLVLRNHLPNAAWMLAIDLLALGSVGLSGGTITSLFEFAAILLLPGAISGAGLWLLMDRTVRGQMQLAGGASPPANANGSRRGVWLGLAAISLLPLFFFGIWAYAASQLALAKLHGIYDTPEQAIIASNSQGWGGAEVLRIENVHAGPDSVRGLPHVWFGGATVYLDRIPDGGRRDTYVTGSFYVHVADGWIHVPEGAFPPFIGWVMELYGMEGVGS